MEQALNDVLKEIRIGIYKYKYIWPGFLKLFAIYLLF